MLFSYVEIHLFLATFKRKVLRQRLEKKKKKKKKSLHHIYITSLPTTLIKISKFNFQTCLSRFLVETQNWVKKLKRHDVCEENKKEDDGEKERKKQEEEKEEDEGIGLKT
jgi:hypothetical protein